MPTAVPATADAPPPSLASGAGARSRVLIVDDEEAIRLALARFLRQRQYDAEAAGDGDDALAALAAGPRFALMFCDVRMPGLGGLDLLRRALTVDPDLAVVMLSAVNDAPTATEAIAAGAMDYLIKPVELPELQRAAERALHRRSLNIHRQEIDGLIRDEVGLRTAELEREQRALRALTVNVAEALVTALETKDRFARGHSQRVAALAASLAEELGLDAERVEAVRLAGRLHDVGKIGTPEALLNKPAPLTAAEFEEVRQHVAIGMTILRPLTHLGIVLDFVQDHHEHWDGSGYPRGLRGDAISIGGRILGAADAYVAITAGRAHRGARTPAETMAYLATQVGTLLDPGVYDALSRVVRNGGALTFLDEAPS